MTCPGTLCKSLFKIEHLSYNQLMAREGPFSCAAFFLSYSGTQMSFKLQVYTQIGSFLCLTLAFTSPTFSRKINCSINCSSMRFSHATTKSFSGILSTIPDLKHSHTLYLHLCFLFPALCFPPICFICSSFMNHTQSLFPLNLLFSTLFHLLFVPVVPQKWIAFMTHHYLPVHQIT